MTDSQLKFLSDVISFQSVGTVPALNAPYGKNSREVLDFFLDYANKLGFKTSVIENKVGTIDIGTGDKIIAVLCHLDVVPAGDGWNTAPFELTIDNNIMYGRGIVDDKGPACASLFAMERINLSQIPEDITVRLILGTDEERGCDCIKTYAECGKTPIMAITPDAEYPVIFAEKGILHLKIESDTLSDNIKINGGTAPNAVPAKATASYLTSDGKAVEFCAEGKAAHASRPELGINAIYEAVKLLKSSGVDISSSNLISYINDNLMNEATPVSFSGCAISDDSGELTYNLGIIHMDDKENSLMIDIRYPVTSNSKAIIEYISNIAAKYNLKCLTDDDMKPIMQNINSPLITSLNEIWINNMSRFSGFKNEYTEIYNKPIAIGGGTYARHLANTVAFGIQAPWQIDQCHQANESLAVSDFEAITDIIYQAIIKMIEMNS
ncbi:MAG: Sapep family Mn(2+)-dependent dipeptidase [Clostridia bacterium]|nr:Sapep family Mn(2+)-dependent dipeptidase [Clostridia bacterium]